MISQQQTPAATPLRNIYNMSAHHQHHQQQHMTPNTNKKLPLIVDIALDDNGKQLYQVHESSKLVRKEMPRSTNFSATVTNTNLDSDLNNPESSIKQEYHDDHDSENILKTPSNKFLGTLSPNSSQSFNHQSIQDHHHHIGDIYSGYTSEENNQNSHSPDHSNRSSYLSASSSSAKATATANDNDIWSDDVEQAFEEVLRIIPKNGLNKIKISGRSCGRNELISDYIYTKTGKFRSRKQVSSHIQVIKNLGQKSDIIHLINKGPTFESIEQQTECNKKFEEIFSKINLSKSLGFNDGTSSSTSIIPNSSITSTIPPAKRSLSNDERMLKRKRITMTNPLDIKFENFFMSVYDKFFTNPIIFTLQDSTTIPITASPTLRASPSTIGSPQQQPIKKIKQNSNISVRFPGLMDFQNCANIPIFHNMVKIVYPQNLTPDYDFDLGFRSNFSLKCNQLDEIANQHYSLYTSIYSFGKQVLTFTEDDFKLNQDYPFLIKFWKFFLSNLNNKDLNEINIAFKGMTIKQIIYESDRLVNSDITPNNKVSKSKIKLILLWEFAHVDDLKDAVTTTSKLILPSQSGNIESSNENIVSQVLDYSIPHPSSQSAQIQQMHPNQPMSLPQQQHQPHPMVSSSTYSEASFSIVEQPQYDAQQNYMYPTPSTTTLGTNQSMNTNSSFVDLSQMNVQRKFQQLQQQQQQQQQNQQGVSISQSQSFGQYPYQTPMSVVSPQLHHTNTGMMQSFSAPLAPPPPPQPQQQEVLNTNSINLDLGVIPTSSTAANPDYQQLQNYPNDGFIHDFNR
ncbi:TEA/ATTS domain family-domain-containing protein [Scheffersomyces coipomensis]|uniref:TEA/ATTS domain family-domain-containing protein n=1 Tax=Scheffersomyces coipomensis TaxID=1788519 RepID=UPI00315C6C3F